MNIVKSGYITACDGTKLFYRSSGQGLPLIACNGIGCTNTFWQYVESYFSYRLQFITWDYKGHGNSQLPVNWDNLNIESFADDLACLMDKLDIEKAVLIGHSMGVQVIFEAWHRYRERVLGIVPVCGSFKNPMEHFIFEGFGKVFGDLMYYVGKYIPTVAEKAVLPVFESPVAIPIARVIGIHPFLMDRHNMDHYFKHMARMNPRVLALLMHSLQNHSAESYLSDIDVPTLIIAGQHDHFTPYWISLKMHESITNSQLLTIPEGSHVAHMEMPNRVNYHLEKFFQCYFSGQYMQQEEVQCGVAS